MPITVRTAFTGLLMATGFDAVLLRQILVIKPLRRAVSFDLLDCSTP
jgi:hypothetical protein